MSWSPEQVSQLFSIIFWTSVLTALPSGWLADRYGARTLIVVSIVLTSVSTVLLAPAALHAPFSLSLVLRGIGESSGDELRDGEV